jgi:hypothetical protein
MPYQYGEAFQRAGIPNMGRQGAPWCEKNADEELVLMARQNYFHKHPEGYFYALPRYEHMPRRASSASKSLRMIDEYFSSGKTIRLLVAVFATDGGPLPNGSFEPARFSHATGEAYKAEMWHFELETAHLICNRLIKYAY